MKKEERLSEYEMGRGFELATVGRGITVLKGKGGGFAI